MRQISPRPHLKIEVENFCSEINLQLVISKQALPCLKSRIEKLNQDVKSVQS